MRRDRTGEVIDPVDEHYCRRGWIGEGLQVQPCRLCKPHLFSHVPEGSDEAPATAESIAAARRHLRQTLGWE